MEEGPASTATVGGKPSDASRKRERWIADLQATYDRHLGRNWPEFKRQEDLLKDARAWAQAALREIAPTAQDVLELKERVVKQTWDRFVPAHRYHSDFQLGYRGFESALWEEGWPSLEDCALKAVNKPADSEGSQAGPVARPRPLLEAVADDEVRREGAEQDLVRALQSYINKLDNANARDAVWETEIFCQYARENYASRAEARLNGMPSVEPRELFEVGDLTERRDLTGLPTIGDVFKLVKRVKVRRPKHWPDPIAFHPDDSLEMRSVLRDITRREHESFHWLLEEPWDKRFRTEIGDCVNACVRAKREEYELRFPGPRATDPPSAQPISGANTETRPARDVPHRSLPPDTSPTGAEKPGAPDKPRPAEVIKVPALSGDRSALDACPPQAIAAGAIRLGRRARAEIEKFANDAFAVAREQILAEYAGKRNQVLGQVRLTGNSGGYLPAITKWGADRVRRMVLALADAYVEAFTLHGVPSDERAEKDIQTTARQIAAGTISGIRGELDLMNMRTGKHQYHSDGYLNREIEASMNSALHEGVLGLRRQRIESAKTERRVPAAAGDLVQGIGDGAMGRSVLDDLFRRLDEAGVRSDFENTRRQIEEADYLSLERFCKVTEPDLQPDELRRHVQDYLLERFDNVARVFLELVTDLKSLDQYGATLNSWCEEVLPALERDFGPEVDKATLQRLEEVFGTIGGRITGSVDRGRLAERLAHWKANAIKRARRREAAKSGISNLQDHAQARFMDWHRSLREERERRLKELHHQGSSFAGRAVGAIRIYEELLDREVTKRIEIYKDVSDEHRNSEMLSPPQIENLRERVMTSVRSSIGGLQGHLQRDRAAAGDSAPLPNPQRYVTLEANILNVVNTKLRVLETEGAIRDSAVVLLPESPASIKTQDAATQAVPTTVASDDRKAGKVNQCRTGASTPVPPRRTPDLQSSRERLALVETVARELAIVKNEVKAYCTADGLKRKYPTFTLWTLIENSQVKALVDGDAFTPKAYAENLVLSKFGLTSRETLKKDRKKLRKVQKQRPE